MAFHKIPPVSKDKLSSVYCLSTFGSGKKGPIREDTIGTRNPVYLNSSRFYALSLTSRRYLGDGMGYVNTQYVSGANTIYVDDYLDMDGKPRLGLKSQGYNLDKVREQTMNLNIGFKFGLLNVAEYGNDPMLLEFLATHEANSESEAGKNARKSRMVVTLITFKPLVAEAAASKRTMKFEETLEGMNLLGSLRTKKSDGSFVYNTAKMNAIYSIFDLPTKITANEPAQRFDEIMKICMANPEQFAEIVNDATKEIEILLGRAHAGGVLVLTAKTAMFKFDEKTNQEILKFGPGVEKEQQITELAYHLLGDPSLKAVYNSIKETTLQLGAVVAA